MEDKTNAEKINKVANSIIRIMNEYKDTNVLAMETLITNECMRLQSIAEDMGLFLVDL